MPALRVTGAGVGAAATVGAGAVVGAAAGALVGSAFAAVGDAAGASPPQAAKITPTLLKLSAATQRRVPKLANCILPASRQATRRPPPVARAQHSADMLGGVTGR